MYEADMWHKNEICKIECIGLLLNIYIYIYIYICHQTKKFIEETTTTKHISYISTIDVQSIQQNKGRQNAKIVQNINIIQTLPIHIKANSEY